MRVVWFSSRCARTTAGFSIQAGLGRVDKPKIGDSHDAGECDSRLASQLEVSLGSRLDDGRGMGVFRTLSDGTV